MKKYLSLFLSLFFTASIFSGCGSKQVSDINSYVSKVEDIKVSDDIKIVGLGEATHGNHEMQDLKLEVFKSLVKNNNCKVFAIEGDFGGCAKINEYISGGNGTAKDAAAEMDFKIYRTEEIQSLIEWMREYNKDVKNEEEKLKFYGFDMQRYDNSKELLFSYLDKVNKDFSEEYNNLLKDLNNDTAYDIDKSKVKECAKSVEELINKMTDNKDEFIKKTSEREFDFAFQCANSIKENASLRTSGIDYTKLRDEYMKNKIDWIYNYENQKLIFINGHNAHIEKSSSSAIKKCMGEYLSESYGNSYYAIGTDFIESSFNAKTSSKERQVVTINNSNNLSAQFKDLENNEYFMDISKAEENSELKEILDSKIRMNNIGDEKFDSWKKIIKIFYTVNMVPSKAYDGIIIVKKATPSTYVD